MNVGCYQYAPRFGEVERNIDQVVADLASVECDLLVLPELAMSGYQFASREEVAELAEPVPDGVTTRRLTEFARTKGCSIVVGVPERSGEHVYNSAVVIGPAGYLGVYRKTHLFFEETLFFSPGDTGFQVWDLGGVKIGVLVCFDWFYPESARTLALQGAEILCHPSNLVLPHCPDAMVTRCLENRVFAVTANRIGREARGGKPSLEFIGRSQIVSPTGTILHRASVTDAEWVCVDVDPALARQKAINPYNSLLADRRVQFYR